MDYTTSTLVIVRHGQFDKWGQMTEASFAQARDLGRSLFGGHDLAAIVVSDKIRTLITAAAICRDAGAQMQNCFCSIADEKNFDHVKEELGRISRQIVKNDKDGCGGTILMVTHLPILMAFNKENGGDPTETFPPLSGLGIDFDPSVERFTNIEKITPGEEA